jgi:hypothetical protein
MTTLCFRTVVFASACVVLQGTAAFAIERDPLRNEMSQLAQSIKGILEEEKQNSIAVGDFTGPPRLDSQFGPGIQMALIEELEKASVTVNKRADLSIMGTYSDATETISGEDLLIIKINVRILSRNGDELVKLSQRLAPPKIKDNTTIAKVAGATVHIPPSADRADRNKAIENALKEPKATIEGNQVSARPGAEFAVEVHTTSSPNMTPRPRTPQLVDGQAFVTIDKDEVYELRIHNRCAHEGAVTITIDGVNVFAFSKDRDTKTGQTLYSHYIIPPRAETRVSGWYLTSSPAAEANILKFKVTEYGKGAASQLGAPRGKVGTITVTFAAAATSKDKLPSDDGSRSAGGTETGFGPGEKQNIQSVRREIGVVREVVTIRYNR